MTHFIEVKIALKTESSFPNFSHSRCSSCNFSSVQRISQFSKVDINVIQGKHKIPFLFISYSFRFSNSFPVAFAITQLGSCKRKYRREMNATKVWTQVNRSQQFSVVRRQRERNGYTHFHGFRGALHPVGFESSISLNVR